MKHKLNTIIYKEWSFAILLALSIVFNIINKKVLDHIVPNQIVGYAFFFFLGLYIGLIVCKNTFQKYIKGIERERKERQRLHNKKIFENKDEIKN